MRQIESIWSTSAAVLVEFQNKHKIRVTIGDRIRTNKTILLIGRLYLS